MRLFVAIDIPDELRARLDPVHALLAPRVSFRVVAPAQVHLTLKYLGEVPGEKVHKVVAALREVAFSPVKLRTTKPGRFAHLLWLGVKLNSELAQLQLRVARAVRSFTTHDPRPFTPHLTLARFQRLSAEDDATLRSIEAERFDVRWKADSFVLYKSELTRDGPVYEEVERFRISSNKENN